MKNGSSKKFKHAFRRAVTSGLILSVVAASIPIGMCYGTKILAYFGLGAEIAACIKLHDYILLFSMIGAIGGFIVEFIFSLFGLNKKK